MTLSDLHSTDPTAIGYLAAVCGNDGRLSAAVFDVVFGRRGQRETARERCVALATLQRAAGRFRRLYGEYVRRGRGSGLAACA